MADAPDVFDEAVGPARTRFERLKSRGKRRYVPPMTGKADDRQPRYDVTHADANRAKAFPYHRHPRWGHSRVAGFQFGNGGPIDAHGRKRTPGGEPPNGAEVLLQSELRSLSLR